MITHQDAVKIGKSMCDVARRCSEDNRAADNLRHACRGTIIYALDNLWYDVLSNKVKESFGHNKDKFYEECGWPT
jgi:hypothetical protein